MNKQTLQQRYNLFELPYEIMQLEKDIKDKCLEIKQMRIKLSKLKNKEVCKLK